MKRSWIRIALLALATSAAAYPDAYSGEQCPNFSTTEQPYLYLSTAEDYEGVPLYLTNVSVPDLARVPAGLYFTSYFDDKASSLRVRGKWLVCTKPEYAGKCAEVSSSDWKSELQVADAGEKLGATLEDSISSVELLSCSQH